jgi:hypothetical protein
MAVLQAEAIADIVASTLRELNKGKLRQIAQTLQKYEVMKRWFRKDRIIVESGYGIQHSLMTKLDDNAADHVGLFEEDNVNVVDHLENLTVDWVHARTQWAYDIRENSMNSGVARIQKLTKVREAGSMIKLADKLEAAAWAVPPSSNRKTPFGIPYYVVYSATTGFNGTTPSGYTTVAGINPSTTTAWANYTAQYTTLSYDDAVDKMRTAHRKMGFESPVDIADFRGNKGRRYRIYVDEPTIADFEDTSRSQNDDLGPDVAVMDDQAVFKKIPIVWVPYLDDNMASGSNPIYMIDLNSFYPAVKKGHVFRKTGPIRAAKQHNVYENFTDLTYQFVCVDRRCQGLIAKSDPMA